MSALICAQSIPLSLHRTRRVPVTENSSTLRGFFPGLLPAPATPFHDYPRRPRLHVIYWFLDSAPAALLVVDGHALSHCYHHNTLPLHPPVSRYLIGAVARLLMETLNCANQEERNIRIDSYDS